MSTEEKFETKTCNSLAAWVAAHPGRVYRYVVYKKMFTPYEQQKAFSDESQFVSDYYTYGIIEEIINLGSGEWLLGFRTIGVDGEVFSHVEYHKLSDIKLNLFDEDQDVELWWPDKEKEDD
jgi:phage major head subunit gpT-like protein